MHNSLNTCIGKGTYISNILSNNSAQKFTTTFTNSLMNAWTHGGSNGDMHLLLQSCDGIEVCEETIVKVAVKAFVEEFEK